MTESAFRALIFDIGRVIVRVDVGRAVAGLEHSAQLPADKVWSAIQADPHWHNWQEGRIAPRDWHEHLRRRLGFHLSFEQFCAVWNSALDPATILSEELFAELAPRYKLGLLSNTDPIHVAHLEENFGFVRYFPVRVYSCRLGASKPDRAIYQAALQQMGVAPHLTVYIDDAAEYVEAACRAGIQALLFQGPQPLLAELRRRGILTP